MCDESMISEMNLPLGQRCKVGGVVGSNFESGTDVVSQLPLLVLTYLIPRGDGEVLEGFSNENEYEIGAYIRV